MSNIVGMGIDGTNNLVFVWYDDYKVSAGSSKNLSSKRARKDYRLPKEKTPGDIVGMGIDGSNNWVFAWYRDQTVSVGTTVDLRSKKKPYHYELPAEKTPGDILGMGIDGSNNLVLAWYRDGTASAGHSWDLTSARPAYPYELPAERSPTDIVGMGVDGFVFKMDTKKALEVFDNVTDTEGEDFYTAIISGAKDLVKELPTFLQSLTFAWYRDGTVSAGSSKDLSQARMLYNYNR